MPTKLETQAAEALCPLLADGTHFQTGLADGTPVECDLCQGTGLRYPPLSLECQMHGDRGVGLGSPNDFWVICPDCNIPHCHDCHGSGRIPDVTLEKVLDIMVEEGNAPALVNDDNGHWAIASDGMQPLCYDEKHIASSLFIFDDETVWADTPLEAALAHLLSSETLATLARKPPTPE